MNFYHSVSSNKPISGNLLDVFTNAVAAFSVRKLGFAYNGDCMEVYNGTSYSDISFDSNGDLDVSAIASHCGTNDGYVSKIYDQSGNGHHASQTAVANMPKIYDGASQSVFSENGKPQIQGDSYAASSRYTYMDISLEINGYPSAHNFLVMQRSSTTTADLQAAASWGGAANVNDVKYATQLGNSGGAGIGTSLHIDGSASSVANQKNTFGTAIGANARVLNSIQNYNRTGTAVARLGAGGSANMQHLQEFIIFDSDMSNDRAYIENNQNAYFNVY